MMLSPAVVGISFTRSHPLQYHTDCRCWFAAKEGAERTNNNKCIPNYKRFSPAVVGISFTRSHPLQYHTDCRCWFAAKEVAERTNNNKIGRAHV